MSMCLEYLPVFPASDTKKEPKHIRLLLFVEFFKVFVCTHGEFAAGLVNGWMDTFSRIQCDYEAARESEHLLLHFLSQATDSHPLCVRMDRKLLAPEIVQRLETFPATFRIGFALCADLIVAKKWNLVEMITIESWNRNIFHTTKDVILISLCSHYNSKG